MSNKFTKRGESRFPVRWTITLLLLSLQLTACDGGIFGTGDGGDIIDIPDSAINTPTDELPGMSPEATPGITLGAPDQNFDNAESVVNRPNALLRIIQAVPALQENIVVTNNDNDDLPLLPLPGLSFLDAVDQYRSVPAAPDHNISFFLSEQFRAGDAAQIAGINPLNLAAGSVTTLILRGSPDSELKPVELLSVATDVTVQDTEVKLRVIHAASTFSESGEIDVYLLGSGDTVSAVQPEIVALSYTDSPISQYTGISSGEYRIAITSAGQKTIITELNPTVSLAAKQVITLILVDDITGGTQQLITTISVEDSAL